MPIYTAFTYRVAVNLVYSSLLIAVSAYLVKYRHAKTNFDGKHLPCKHKISALISGIATDGEKCLGEKPVSLNIPII